MLLQSSLSQPHFNFMRVKDETVVTVKSLSQTRIFNVKQLFFAEYFVLKRNGVQFALIFE